MRIRIDLAYDGTSFSGWARQPERRTVQSVLEATIAQVLRLSEPPPTICAGRTDAGVHARGQVVHLDLPDLIPQPRNPVSIPEALSSWLPRALPDDIVVREVRQVLDTFDARFSALNRRYVYRLWDSPVIDPLTRGFVLTYPHSLSVATMEEASRHLLGLHDFAAFCRPKDYGTTVRTLLCFSPERLSSGMIEVTVVADAFCHSMVRSLVGGLVAVGGGRRDSAWLESQLSANCRAHDIIVMPAHGLTLEEVSYPPDEELAQRAAQARTRRDEECE